MASGFFAVLDDIVALMDDVAATSKIAAKQTAGILGDDLAVNAEKATGFLSSREIPVLMQIMKGSFINKLIIVPIAFLLQWLYPPIITGILILGGLYLAYEGAEKIIHFFFHKKTETVKDVIENYSEEEARKIEKEKIKSAIMTDFILSIEIVIIALGTVLTQSLALQIITVSIIAIVATVGVYGIVALIVRMDDAGYRLIKSSKHKGIFNKIGELLVKALPWVIKGLSVVGTIALLLVSGGIFDHNIDYLHHLMSSVPEMFKQFIYGLVAGVVMVGLVTVFKKIFMPSKL